MVSCASMPGFRGICLQTTGAMYLGRSARDFPAWTTTCSTTSHTTTGRISGLSRTALTAWTSCSMAASRSPSLITSIIGNGIGDFQEILMTDTYLTSATRYIDAEGIRYAYRRFGRETGVPLVLFQNFRQGMDNVDPLLLNGFRSRSSGHPVRQCRRGEFERRNA